MHRCFYILGLLFVFFLSACTPQDGKIDSENTVKKPASPAMEYYTNKTVGYSVPLIKDWKVNTKADADLFLETSEGSFIPPPYVNYVSVADKPYDLWDAGALKQLKSKIDPNLKTAEEKKLTLGGKKAYNLVYGIEKDGVSVIVNQTYLFHNNYFLVITCSAREEEYNRFAPVFTEFINKTKFF